MSKAVWLFAWWFIWYGTGGTATHGPFGTQKQCEEHRVIVERQMYGKTIPCWSSGL
jgi:hypothetical protein